MSGLCSLGDARSQRMVREMPAASALATGSTAPGAATKDTSARGGSGPGVSSQALQFSVPFSPRSKLRASRNSVPSNSVSRRCGSEPNSSTPGRPCVGAPVEICLSATSDAGNSLTPTVG